MWVMRIEMLDFCHINLIIELTIIDGKGVLYLTYVGTMKPTNKNDRVETSILLYRVENEY